MKWIVALSMCVCVCARGEHGNAHSFQWSIETDSIANELHGVNEISLTFTNRRKKNCEWIWFLSFPFSSTVFLLPLLCRIIRFIRFSRRIFICARSFIYSQNGWEKRAAFKLTLASSSCPTLRNAIYCFTPSIRFWNSTRATFMFDIIDPILPEMDNH